MPADAASFERHDPYASLRVRNYRWFIVSLFTMTVGSQIQVIVVSWQIYNLTHDPLSLGLIGLAEALPFIGVALYAGHLADRLDRRGIRRGRACRLCFGEGRLGVRSDPLAEERNFSTRSPHS